MSVTASFGHTLLGVFFIHARAKLHNICFVKFTIKISNYTKLNKIIERHKNDIIVLTTLVKRIFKILLLLISCCATF